MALWLSWYLRLKKFSISPVTLGHELLHWIGLIATVFLVSRFVELGVFSRFLAGIVVLTLTAQAVFLAGIYIEKTFLFIGIVLGIFAWIVAFAVEYLYLWIALPPSWIAAFSVRPPDTRLNSPSRVAFSMSSDIMRRISNGRVATFHALRVTPRTSVSVSSCI